MLISGMVTYISYDMIVESKKTAFLHDIGVVNDAVEEYYAVNGTLPILSSGAEITVNEYKQKINQLYDADALNSLTEEITLNNDLESDFYEIDISKLNIESSKFGLKESETDVFLVSTNNLVYYYSGYKTSTGIYFSAVKILDKNN